MDERAKQTSGGPIRLWAFVGLVAILLVALVAVVPLGGGPAPAPRVKQFKSVAGGFSVSYPTGWKKLSAAELSGLEGSFAFAVQSKKPDALLGVRIQPPLPGEIKLSDAAGQMDREMTSRFDGFKKISDAAVRLKSGEDALRYEYSFLSEDRSAVRALVLLVPAEKNLYLVNALAAADSYEALRPRFEKAVASFRVD